MTNANNTTLYVGVTNDLMRRVWEHKNNILKGFTARYNLHKLVYFEVYEDEVTAIEREKYLKKCYKKTKKKLITGQNPQWNDLYDEITPI
jgi:putative endonuclease